MNADEIGTKAAGASLDGIVTSAQHRDRVTYLMRNGARAAAVVPVMMVNQWIRDEAILRLAENGIPVHLGPAAPRPEVKISIRGDHIGSGAPGRVVLEGTLPFLTAGQGDARLARELVQESVRVLRQSGYEVAEDPAEDGGGFRGEHRHGPLPAAAPVRVTGLIDPAGDSTLPVAASHRGRAAHRGRASAEAGLVLITMTTDTAPRGNLYLIVGYDGSAPASRALDAAVSLLHSRTGRVEVVYVAHLPAIDMMSADAIGEMEADFNEIERDLRTAAREQLRGREERWGFERRQGQIADELIAAAAGIRDAHPGDTAAIVVGSSSQAMHRVVGSVAVALARRSPVPTVVVP